jgi:hypothetical protein
MRAFLALVSDRPGLGAKWAYARNFADAWRMARADGGFSIRAAVRL